MVTEAGGRLWCPSLLLPGRLGRRSHEQRLCSVLHRSSCSHSHPLCCHSTLLYIVMQVFAMADNVPLSLLFTSEEASWDWLYDESVQLLIKERSFNCHCCLSLCFNVNPPFCLLMIIILWGPFLSQDHCPLRSLVYWGQNFVLWGPLFFADQRPLRTNIMISFPFCWLTDIISFSYLCRLFLSFVSTATNASLFLIAIILCRQRAAEVGLQHKVTNPRSLLTGVGWTVNTQSIQVSDDDRTTSTFNFVTTCHASTGTLSSQFIMTVNA